MLVAANYGGRCRCGWRTDKISILEVESVQLIARLLRIHHVLIDNECSALRIVRNALADLTAGKFRISRSWGWLEDGVERTGWGQICQTDRRVPLV